MMLFSTQRLLTLAGTLPFIAGAIFPDVVLFSVPAPLIVSVYAVAIISFIAGIQWQTASGAAARKAPTVLILSNVITLMAWAACLFVVQDCVYTAYAACFLALLAIDRWCLHLPHTAPDFYRLRQLATLIVVSSLLLLGYR